MTASRRPAFIALAARKFGVAVVWRREHDTYTEIADVTAEFRLCAAAEGGDEKLKAGYPPKALDALGRRARRPGQRRASRRICRASTKASAKKQPRDVIHLLHSRGETARAPAAAIALIERLEMKAAEKEIHKYRRPLVHGVSGCDGRPSLLAVFARACEHAQKIELLVASYASLSRPRAGRAFPSANSRLRSTTKASPISTCRSFGTPAEGRVRRALAGLDTLAYLRQAHQRAGSAETQLRELWC